MFELARGVSPLTYPFGHATHCLDAVRQYVMCNADDTPLATALNERPTGDGQSRMCRSWSKLREWAGEHSACFRDIHSHEGRVPFEDHFGTCKSGGDGLIVEHEML